MPNYLSPGVYIEEKPSGSKPIASAGTSVCAFVGFTERRPAGNRGEPVLVTSWTQYVDNFGEFVSGAVLPLSVYGYFLNGGGICYVQSLMAAEEQIAQAAKSAPKKPTLQLPGKGAEVGPALTIESKSNGAVTLTIADPPPGSPDDQFSVTIKGPDGTEETYSNLTFEKKRGSKHVVDTINKESKLVKLAEVESEAPLAERRPAIGTYTIQAPERSTDELVSATAFEGNLAARVGLAGLEAVEEITMVCVPDVMSGYLSGQLSREDVKAVHLAVIAHCEKMKDRFAILDCLPDLSAQEVNDWRMNEAGYDSKFAALYYPWVWVANPLASKGEPSAVKIPPSGYLAGLYARVDNERGVHKAPANEIVRGVLRLEMNVSKGEQDILNPNGINCIRSFPGRGIRVWGARTLSSDPEWRYINVRRLFSNIEESIYEGTQWVVFEPNDMDLWARVKRTINAYLTNVWRSGALFGATPDEAFFVKCDAELNPPEVRDAGMLVVEVGIAPVKPAEFVIFRFSQNNGAGA